MMPRLLTSLSIVALLAMGGALSAQEATQPAPEAPVEAAEPDAETPAIGLDTGRPVQEDPSYIKSTHDDWQIKCFRTGVEGQEDLCQMYQLMTESAGNPVAEFTIYRLPEGGPVIAGATIAAPLGTLLTEEIKLSVDGANAKSYAYSFCTMAGCFARIGLTQQDIDTMKRGVKVTLEIVPAQAPDQKVKIDASLKGFTAAFEEASILQQ
ncbi:Invasion associated locus B (IalB) protein [Roseovarius sp. EC-HK134]|uniref:Invasion associated locus B (IalB) protein n=2 Tax=Roseobacteraceae TaxID=2854170 RepID=A0A1V0RUU8_9RHOB|nr:invasion associated locus B family protein [Roseovarius sp. TM1035]ARE85445.1 invasion associated locus B (IalB) protein [Roseovarius mucosus]VVT28331.1 Invasion associated locus B (IalB) protein [Roseovarius sp. EC-SD190]VVT28783.1 Invasion associated locus B (IalB) protein [Roseovarius sp. EC-HK134]